MNRRDFLRKTATGMTALGGGVYLLGAASPKEADRAAKQLWRSTWRPETPHRLPDATHALAQRAIAGEHGRGMVRAD